MALDVWIGKPSIGKYLKSSRSPMVKLIDQYDGAIFESTELVPILGLLDKAKALISAQTEQFEVHMGTSLGSYLERKNEEIYHTVVRDDYLIFIEMLRSAVFEAQKLAKPLVFYGD